jgi:hypothetical protein
VKVLALLLVAMLLAGCKLGQQPRYYYSDIEAANLTGSEIRNVKIEIGPRELSCASVANFAQCQDRFGKRPYPPEPIRISWQDSNGQQQMQQPNPPIPLTYSPAIALRVLLEINADGTVKAHFRQDGFFN